MQMITIAGSLGKDAVAKTTQDGQQLLNFSVAVSGGFGDKKTTTWYDVTKWGKGGDKLAPYMLKGCRVAVCGELSTREYDGKTYLQVNCAQSGLTLQNSKQDNPSQSNGSQGHSDGFQSKPASGGFGADDLDDDVPFADCSPKYEWKLT
jgi:single-strand DNA-binding protein